MNRRLFLRGSAVAAASGLAWQADALGFLARNPTSIVRPDSMRELMARFDYAFKLHPLAFSGDYKKYQLLWTSDTMPSLIEGQSHRVMTKIVRAARHRTEYPYEDELTYQVALKRREIVMDCAHEEGWLERYRRAGYPDPA